MPDFPELSEVPEFGPVRQQITPEQFMQMWQGITEMYAEDVARLRKRLGEEGQT